MSGLRLLPRVRWYFPGMRISCTAAQHVISDTLEADTIVIDIRSGAYYTLTPAAGGLWEQVRETGACEVSERGPDADVLAALLGEGLLTSDWVPSGPAAVTAFTRYTDMEELLLADPIHEVDPDGWPVFKRPDG